MHDFNGLIAGGDFDEVRRLRKIIAELEAT